MAWNLNNVRLSVFFLLLVSLVDVAMAQSEPLIYYPSSSMVEIQEPIKVIPFLESLAPEGEDFSDRVLWVLPIFTDVDLQSHPQIEIARDILTQKFHDAIKSDSKKNRLIAIRNYKYARTNAQSWSLLSPFIQHPDLEIRAAAMLAIKQLGDPRGIGVLIECLESSDMSTRYNCCRVLLVGPSLERDKARNVLLELSSKDGPYREKSKNLLDLYFGPTPIGTEPGQ